MAKNKTVLITGITGFIGAHVALKLLQAGFSVRGAVRSTKKGELLVQQAIFDEYRSRFTVVEVPNIEEPGAFDEAVKGYPVSSSLYWYRQVIRILSNKYCCRVQIVVHLASPVVLSGVEPESIIGPAKRGTIGILQSIANHASPDFSHFVLMSSIAAMMRRDVAPGYVFSENDWSRLTEDLLQTMEPAQIKDVAYYASKTIAERALWEFMETNKVNTT
jgi:nucleoside-diphosphate-sugar epimerase